MERSRIQRISGPVLARNWVMIPHVTHNDEADITELEAWRKQLNDEHRAATGRRSRWCRSWSSRRVATLKAFPTFNASLDGEDLILKRYYNIGFAADTPGGLVVPVIKNADQKGLLEIARELTELSGKARDGKLMPGDMQGATFTISSLGGIGGTSFTPIINAPEVAILGATRSAMKPVWNGQRVRPAADGPAVAVLRPPGDRRRRRGAVHGPPRQGPERSEAGAAVTEVRVPDIGDFTDVPVIEIHVSPGDEVAVEDPLVTLESDKATMDVPAPEAGTVKQLRVKIGDRVSEGSVLLTLESDGAARGRLGRSRRRPATAAPARQLRHHHPPTSVEREPAPPPPASSNGAGGDHDAQVVVIGSGPGGYTAAFRAADLGLKTVLIERYDTLGGVCLNVGCIPSKALLHAARVVAEAEEMAEHGIKFGKPKVDIDALREWKASVVGKLTGGLAGLAKQRKVEVVTGVASLHRSEHGAASATGRSRSTTASSRPARRRRRCPALPDDERIFSSTGALELPVDPEAAARDRLRDHRPRDGDGVRRARLEGDDGRAARPADPGLRPRPGQAAAEADLRRATRRSTSAPRSSRSRPRTKDLEVKLSSGDSPRRSTGSWWRSGAGRTAARSAPPRPASTSTTRVHPRRPAAAHERPRDLRDRRRRRRPDARPQGLARGQGRRRGDRGRSRAPSSTPARSRRSPTPTPRSRGWG